MTVSEAASLPKSPSFGDDRDHNKTSKLTLFSALPPAGLLTQFDAGFIAEPSERDALLALWQKANGSFNRFSPLRAIATKEDVEQLQEVEERIARLMLSRAKSYPPYDSHSTGIYNVRISKLVTPQVTLNIQRAHDRFPVVSGMKEAELFDLSFRGSVSSTPITRQILGVAGNGGALLFTSYDEDVRLHHPPQYRRIPINDKDRDSPTFESVCFPVGGGLPFASAYRIQISEGNIRLVLNNGIHRVFRLAESGYQWCPMLVCDLVPLELPDPFVDLPRDVLLGSNSIPPMVSDFLNSEVVIPLRYHALLKTIRLNWNFEQYVTVLK